jgi:hypothetical protein
MEDAMVHKCIGLLCLFTVFLGSACNSKGDESREGIYPSVTTAFGKIVTVQGQIRLAKRPTPPPKMWQDHYNIKITAVESKELSAPVVVECGVFNKSIGDKLHLNRFKKDDSNEQLLITGYESVRTEGNPEGLGQVIPGEVPQNSGWHVHRIFVILKIEPLKEEKRPSRQG